jgi:hypothetical protein
MSRLPLRPAAALLLLGLVPVLDGCGPKKDEFPPVCPHASFVWDAADLNRYRDESATATQDVRDLVLSARLTGLPAKCSQGDTAKLLNAEVGVTIQFTRGPAMQGRTATVPFFLAVTDGGRILDKHVYATSVTFPENIDQVTWSSDLVHMVFPISPTKTGAAYTVLAGFQLTPDELAVNRRRGPRQP